MSSGVTDARSALHDATVERLRAHPKELPAVWLYDERGAQLYERIMQLPEYYLPRREAEVLRSHAPEIATRTKARTLVELGAGSASNTRYLLDALERARTLERFVPFDASPEMLELGARAVAAAYPRVSVDAVVGDFEHDLDKLPRRGPRLVTFLGSTIGNLHADERVKLLGALAAILEKDDALVIGVDLVKDVVRLEAAYNDASGVTEAFVRNALAHVNRELDATFDQRRFAYEARWDPGERVGGHGPPRPRGALGPAAASPDRADVRSRRVVAGRDQHEVPARRDRARCGWRRPGLRVVVDGRRRRLRGRPSLGKGDVDVRTGLGLHPSRPDRGDGVAGADRRV
jgi:L-histidine N-alpha-methyltransferase